MFFFTFFKIVTNHTKSRKALLYCPLFAFTLIKFAIFLIFQTSSTKIRIISSFQNVISYEGFRGLFAGNLTNCVRIFPTSAIVCLVYSRMIKVSWIFNLYVSLKSANWTQQNHYISTLSVALTLYWTHKLPPSVFSFIHSFSSQSLTQIYWILQEVRVSSKLKSDGFFQPNLVLRVLRAKGPKMGPKRSVLIFIKSTHGIFLIFFQEVKAIPSLKIGQNNCFVKSLVLRVTGQKLPKQMQNEAFQDLWL